MAPVTTVTSNSGSLSVLMNWTDSLFVFLNGSVELLIAGLAVSDRWVLWGWKKILFRLALFVNNDKKKQSCILSMMAQKKKNNLRVCLLCSGPHFPYHLQIYLTAQSQINAVLGICGIKGMKSRNAHFMFLDCKSLLGKCWAGRGPIRPAVLFPHGIYF